LRADSAQATRQLFCPAPKKQTTFQKAGKTAQKTLIFSDFACRFVGFSPIRPVLGTNRSRGGFEKMPNHRNIQVEYFPAEVEIFPKKVLRRTDRFAAKRKNL